VLGLAPDEIYRSPPDEAEIERLERMRSSEARRRAAEDDDLKAKG
jgi:hypothetical protein